LTQLGVLLNSSLTDADLDVPEGHYAQDNMNLTVVPNRNMIMLSIAAAIAVSDGAHILAAGMHAGDHFIYPDCRPEFMAHMQNALKVGNEGFASDLFALHTPFINSTKANIGIAGHGLGIDWTKQR